MKQDEMNQLNQSIHECRKCPLGSLRTHAVAGEGSLDAEVLFIGEAPGFHEDQQGIPFVGRAGTILTTLLNHIHLKREDVFIANILKCRPPENRNPQVQEMNLCTPFLDKQIAIIQPRIIAPLGNFSYRYIFSKYDIDMQKISVDHGRIFQKQTILGPLVFIPMYHPAVATYNPHKIEVLRQDFEVLKKCLQNVVVNDIG